MDFRAEHSEGVKTSSSHVSVEGITALSISMPIGPTVETATIDAQRVWEQLKFNVPASIDKRGLPDSDRSKRHSSGAVRPHTLADRARLRTLRVASER